VQEFKNKMDEIVTAKMAAGAILEKANGGGFQIPALNALPPQLLTRQSPHTKHFPCYPTIYCFLQNFEKM
jgi:hypothetical protein